MLGASLTKLQTLLHGQHSHLCMGLCLHAGGHMDSAVTRLGQWLLHCLHPQLGTDVTPEAHTGDYVHTPVAVPVAVALDPVSWLRILHAADMLASAQHGHEDKQHPMQATEQDLPATLASVLGLTATAESAAVDFTCTDQAPTPEQQQQQEPIPVITQALVDPPPELGAGLHVWQMLRSTAALHLQAVLQVCLR